MFGKSTTNAVRDFLKTIPIFSDLSWLELRRLETIVHERVYQEGEVVFYEKEPGVGMFIVSSGRIELFKEVKGREQELASFRPGDCFGEIALLTEHPRTATARALERTKLFGFFRPDLLDLLAHQPAMGAKVLLKVAQIIASRMIKTLDSQSSRS